MGFDVDVQGGDGEQTERVVPSLAERIAALLEDPMGWQRNIGMGCPQSNVIMEIMIVHNCYIHMIQL